MDAFEELGGDVVVKPLFGSLGAGMARVSDRDVAYRVFRALEVARSVYYLQEFIPHGNMDIRAFVVGGRAVASMRRVAEDWKTNISGGAKPEPHELEEDHAEISVRASEVLGLEYAGVDLLRSDRDGSVYVVELNSTPGWQALQSVTGRSITALIVDHLLSRLG